MERSGRDDPQLEAELSAFSAADALQWAGSSKMTGNLTFRSEGARIVLRVDRGKVVFAASNRRIEGLGRHLFAEGLVDEVDLAAAVVYSRDNQSRIGAAMVELQVLPEEAVREALHYHIVNLATIPVAWPGGKVTAEIGRYEGIDGLDPEPADAVMVLMEAARRADEIPSLRRVIPSADSVFAAGDAVLPEDASPRLGRALETHKDGTTIRSHYERLGGSHFGFLETVRDLANRGVLTLVDDEPI